MITRKEFKHHLTRMFLAGYGAACEDMQADTYTDPKEYMNKRVDIQAEILFPPLRFTTSPPHDSTPLVYPKDRGKLIGKARFHRTTYIHGDAEKKARYDIPIFIDGDLGELDLPVEDQHIYMILPEGEYRCKAEVITHEWDPYTYYITLLK